MIHLLADLSNQGACYSGMKVIEDEVGQLTPNLFGVAERIDILGSRQVWRRDRTDWSFVRLRP